MKVTRHQIVYFTGQRMRQLRQRLELSRPEMAKKLNLTRNALGKIENGLIFPNLVILQQLSREYQISLDWLILDKGEQLTQESQRVKDLETELAAARQDLQALKQIKEGSNMVELDPEVSKMVEHMKSDKFIHHNLLAQYQQLIKDNTVE